MPIVEEPDLVDQEYADDSLLFCFIPPVFWIRFNALWRAAGLSGHVVYEEEIMLLVISASSDDWPGFGSQPGDSRIGLLVPAVTELVIAELLYLQWLDPRQPTYVYINSTGTSRADGETVGMETEGFAIYDTMMLVRNEIQTVAVGAAIGQACLLLSAGTKGKRYMLPHATAMIQQPRLPSTGQMPAIDVHIRAKEVVNNRDTLATLLAKHTGNSFEKVSKVMQRPFYMDPRKAIEFGVADKILWRGQEAMAETLSADAWDKRAGIRVMERPMTYGANNQSGLG
ncbi:hypothetical protein L7F22_050905 [Adiantum nelumboides]|nr:hypothetical protein [Adiantum nelumboides]